MQHRMIMHSHAFHRPPTLGIRGWMSAVPGQQSRHQRRGDSPLRREQTASV